MFNFKKKPEALPPEQPIDDTKHEIHDLRHHALSRKVAEQEIMIRRLLEIVVMNIEHKDYSKHLLPKITQLQNLLDKK